MSACPCGRTDARGKAVDFAACCGRFVDDFANTPAPDAEALMRSRYCAYVLGRPAYLQATWHPSRRPAGISPEPGTQWLGLEVRAHQCTDADHAEVEFVARYRLAGRAVRLHERSRFLRQAGRWFYLDGEPRGAAGKP